MQSLPGKIGTHDVADCMGALAAAVEAGEDRQPRRRCRLWGRIRYTHTCTCVCVAGDNRYMRLACWPLVIQSLHWPDITCAEWGTVWAYLSMLPQ